MSAAARDFLRLRREALSRHPVQIGIDFVSVAPPGGDPLTRQATLHFIPAAANPDLKHDALDRLTPAQLRLVAGEVPGEIDLQVVGVSHPAGRADLEVQFRLPAGEQAAARVGEKALLTLKLQDVPELDPFFREVRFSLDPVAPRELDCLMDCPPPTSAPPPTIDYLARDYSSFRRLMLDRLAVLLPDWTERNAADLWVTLVEVLADSADQLSYYQDAVATEAYLGTARQRISLRRHARLAGYEMHEGQNARAWVQLLLEGTGRGVAVPAGTQVLTRLAGLPRHLNPASSSYRQALAKEPVVFETLQDALLFDAHQQMTLYTWGAVSYGLAFGATGATLMGHLPDLKQGDVLIFEEVLGQQTGLATDADLTRRHAVRLDAPPTLGSDPLGGDFLNPPSPGALDITEITWFAEDALPFPFCIAARLADGAPITGVTVARGNVVLADHGRSVTPKELAPVPPAALFRPQLSAAELTQQVAYDPVAASGEAAAAALSGEPRGAQAALRLADNEGQWTLRRDLLASDRRARDFVVEMDNRGGAHLRFGDDISGRRPAPGTLFTATYRVGNGTVGNVAPDSLVHVVTDQPGVGGARNPLAARGGREPEPVDQVRRAVPQIFSNVERCVTTADFARLAESHPEVERAAASLRWSGSWHVLFLAVARRGGLPVDDAFKNDLRAFLESFRQAVWELEIAPLHFVGLDIAMTVEVDADALRGTVEQRLAETFSNRGAGSGPAGLFHPDNFTFGQSVYLSQLVAAAVNVPGVRSVDFDDTPPKRNRFHPFGQPPRGELETGEIRIGSLEIARLDNDPARPEDGRVCFFLEGGR